MMHCQLSSCSGRIISNQSPASAGTRFTHHQLLSAVLQLQSSTMSSISLERDRQKEFVHQTTRTNTGDMKCMAARRGKHPSELAVAAILTIPRLLKYWPRWNRMKRRASASAIITSNQTVTECLTSDIFSMFLCGVSDCIYLYLV